ncbi:MAG TPA: polysaccharide deacetylase family protein [Thermoplasmata archaeon]|nr:polysaccharide deacetylase family protein [Thermoplasmata archaeon]
MYFLMTNDVELTTTRNVEDPAVAGRLLRDGIPTTLDLYSTHDVRATFFFTGNFVQTCPEAVDLVRSRGHEIGCHAMSHDSRQALDSMGEEEQYALLSRAKKIVEGPAGPVEAFRAPELRINRHSVRALERAGFRIDSSVAPQRFDGPLSWGTRTKLQWMTAPRRVYRMARDDPFAEGDSGVTEVPVSALLVPYMGTSLRISPALVGAVGRLLGLQARDVRRPVVFILHPYEFLEETHPPLRGGPGVVEAIRGRYREELKRRNLGKSAVKLIETMLKGGRRRGFEFVGMSEFLKLSGARGRGTR